MAGEAAFRSSPPFVHTMYVVVMALKSAINTQLFVQKVLNETCRTAERVTSGSERRGEQKPGRWRGVETHAPRPRPNVCPPSSSDCVALIDL